MHGFTRTTGRLVLFTLFSPSIQDLFMPLAQVAYVDFVVGRCTVCWAEAERDVGPLLVHLGMHAKHFILAITFAVFA